MNPKERPHRPISSERVAAGGLGLSQPRFDGGLLYWLEARPDEGGRQVVVRAREPGVAADATPPGTDVRTRVHEYGGGDYAVRDGSVFYSDGADGRARRVDAAGGPPRVATPRAPQGARYADFDVSPDTAAGALTFASDRTGWWNLYQLRDGAVVPLAPREAEFGRAQWVFGMSTWDCAGPDAIACCIASGGEDRIALLAPATGRLRFFDLPFTAVEGLRVARGRAAFVGAGPQEPPGIFTLDLATGGLARWRTSAPGEIDPATVSVPEAISFPTADGARAHAFLYRPRPAGVRARAGQRPPLLVKIHGGPTAAASSALDLRVQYWTSHGFALVDVNYRGSTGYGRAYRDALAGGWGVVDVADCVAAARFVAGRGEADARRMAIHGSSAGGFTALCALTFHDVFRAGASHYGIGDLEALVRDTHKFEARYTDRLVGPYPERRDLYRARSPVHAAERLSCPVIFFQGLDDPVVPPRQAEAMVAALAARGIPHAYVSFPGERHGFRRAESIRTALDGELFFYARVFGLDVEVRPAGIDIVGEDALAPRRVW